MTSPDYDIHLDRSQYDSLFDGEETEAFPFGEDMAEIDRAIEEELGPRKSRRNKVRR